jgi:hypothetical protein
MLSLLRRIGFYGFVAHLGVLQHFLHRYARGIQRHPHRGAINVFHG